MSDGMSTLNELRTRVHDLDQQFIEGEISLVEFFCEMEVIMDRAMWLVERGETS